MPGPVGGLRKHPHGRVDQLEDRYLGMVEAPSSNLGTSTSILPIEVSEVDCAAKTDSLLTASVFGSARPPETTHNKSVGRVPQTCNAAFRSSLLARHVHQKPFTTSLLDVCHKLATQHFGQVSWLGRTEKISATSVFGPKSTTL